MQDPVDLEREIEKIDKGSPYIIIVSSDVSYQFFVVIEKHILPESGSITTAILDLYASYFTFDIVYPKPLYALLLFIQHYVLCIKDQQPVPNNVHILYSSLTKMSLSN